MNTFPKLFKFKPLHVLAPNLFERVWNKRKQAWTSKARSKPVVSVTGRILKEDIRVSSDSKPPFSVQAEVLELNLDYTSLEERAMLGVLAGQLGLSMEEAEKKVAVVQLTDRYTEMKRQRDDYRAALITQTHALIDVVSSIVTGDTVAIEVIKANATLAILAQKELLKVLKSEEAR